MYSFIDIVVGIPPVEFQWTKLFARIYRDKINKKEKRFFFLEICP